MMKWHRDVLLVPFVLFALAGRQTSQAQSTDSELEGWLAPQEWMRDTPGPVLSLGPEQAFDNQHIFAPCVARDGGQFSLWYCGSRGTVEDRVFGLGLVAGQDGRSFLGRRDDPVFAFADHRRSILTPTLLADVHGIPIREAGKLRVWFSSTDFHDKSGLHTLHEATSEDGIHWSQPSAALLPGVYAPSIVKTADRYRLWYTDVSQSPWVIRYAESNDGRAWQVDRQVALRVDQAWEMDRLFYPAVREVKGVLLMWYGSYWKGQGAQKTALGFAVSRDGRAWKKHPQNPVLRPDASRTWESHYVTSQSLIQLDDGSWRIWYASRTKPPYVHKYFAIGTAVWRGPDWFGQAKQAPAK